MFIYLADKGDDRVTSHRVGGILIYLQNFLNNNPNHTFQFICQDNESYNKI